MKFSLLFVCLASLCYACSSNDQPEVMDASMTETSTDSSADHLGMVDGVSDATEDTYNPCATTQIVPLTSGSPAALACIVQHICTDNAGKSATTLYDTCHGNFQCVWDTNCADGLTYCLPALYISAPLYTDATCKTPIVIANVTDAGLSVEKYVSIQYYPIRKDAGPSVTGCVNVFAITTLAPEQEQTDAALILYYLGYDYPYPRWNCNPTLPIIINGAGYFFINETPVVPSNNFVAQ